MVSLVGDYPLQCMTTVPSTITTTNTTTLP